MFTLPSWRVAKDAVDKEKASPLEQFVYCNEPAGQAQAKEFREHLTIAIKAILAQQHDELNKKIEELRKDAERYRWLRQQHWESGKFGVVENPKEAIKLGRFAPSGLQLDEAIDNEMR
jgi:hypothetical protein